MLTLPPPRPIPADLEREWRRAGVLNDQSVGGLLAHAARQWGTRTALIDLTDDGRALSYAGLYDEVSRLTAFLRARGVGTGDVILIQSPNCREVAVAWWAAWHAGCVCVPVVDIYRAHEMRQIVASVHPEVVVTTVSYRGHHHADMFDAIFDDLGLAPKVRLAVRGEATGWTPFEAALASPAGSGGGPDPAEPGAPALVLFTSGTTARSKGVVHTSRSIVAEGYQMLHAFGVDWRDRCYMPLPLSHVTGMDLGIIVPGLTGSSVVLSRMAGLTQASEELVEAGATWTSGPPAQVPVIVERFRESERTDVPLRIFATGGTTVHRFLVEQGEELGFQSMRCYGMTEMPTVTMPGGYDTPDQRLASDGRIAHGAQCEAVDPDTREPLPQGAEGELRARGPERMRGYLDAEQSLEQIDDQGWFYSGDLGRVDEDGCVFITGRIKDIINRGGEKFSAREIEEVLLGHGAVAEVAVVPAVDDRFGEVPAAFVVGSRGIAPASGEDLSAYLAMHGVARQKTPVHWRWVEELPTTPSGKVKKYELRQQLDSHASSSSS